MMVYCSSTQIETILWCFQENSTSKTVKKSEQCFLDMKILSLRSLDIYSVKNVFLRNLSIPNYPAPSQQIFHISQTL